MSQLSLDKFGENLPVSGVVAFSQVAVGLGIGILVADRIGSNARRGLAIGLLSAGVATLVPVSASVRANAARGRRNAVCSWKTAEDIILKPFPWWTSNPKPWSDGKITAVSLTSSLQGACDSRATGQGTS